MHWQGRRNTGNIPALGHIDYTSLTNPPAIFKKHAAYLAFVAVEGVATQIVSVYVQGKVSRPDDTYQSGETITVGKGKERECLIDGKQVG